MHQHYITTFIGNQPKGYLSYLANLAGKDFSYFFGMWNRVKKGLANEHDKELLCKSISKAEAKEIVQTDFLWIF